MSIYSSINGCATKTLHPLKGIQQLPRRSLVGAARVVSARRRVVTTQALFGKGADSNVAYYTIKKGDTLSSIAQRYNVDWRSIQNANKNRKETNGQPMFPGLVKGTSIRPSQQLMIPDAKALNSKDANQLATMSSTTSPATSSPGPGIGGLGSSKTAFLVVLAGLVAFTLLPKKGKKDGGAQASRAIGATNITELTEKLKGLELSPAALGTTLAELNLPPVTLGSVLYSFKLSPEELKDVVAKLNLDEETLADVLQRLELSPDAAESLVSQLNLSSSAAEDLTSKLIPTSKPPPVELSNQGSELVNRLLNMKMSGEELADLIPKLNLTAGDLAEVLPKSNMSTSEVTQVLSTVGMTPEELSDVLPSLSLSGKNLAKLVSDLGMADVSSLQKMLPRMNMPVGDMKDVLSNAGLSESELQETVSGMDLSEAVASTLRYQLGLMREELAAQEPAELVGEGQLLADKLKRLNLPDSQLLNLLKSMSPSAEEMKTAFPQLNSSKSVLIDYVKSTNLTEEEKASVVKAL